MIPATPEIDSARVLADLRELNSRTGGPGGAQRVCWTEGWRHARELIDELLDEAGLPGAERDEAGNAWVELPGSGDAGALVVGSHVDSVPSGGWLDGALGAMAALGVLRAWAAAEPAARPLRFVDWADEEGAFGRSLLGSSAVSGTLDPSELEDALDRDGRPAAEALRENGVEPGRMLEAGSRLDGVAACLELHIEQGPILEAKGICAAAVTGCAGLERVRIRFEGRASHAGTTPMDARADAGLAAAELALDVERIARAGGGVGTVGIVELGPGATTVVPGSAEMTVDLRHPEAGPLAEMLGAVREAARDRAGGRGCEVSESPIWRIEPIAFDPEMVALAADACEERAGSRFEMASGALHDAAEMARRVPTAMIFSPSTAGLSHTPREDTPADQLRAAIDAYGAAASRFLTSG